MKILYEYRVFVYRILFKAKIQFDRSIAKDHTAEGGLRPVIIAWVQSIAQIIQLPPAPEEPIAVD